MEITSPPSRGQLRLIADSEEASPQSRISAVNSLLQLYGASDRNLRLARRVSKRFGKFVGDTETGQRRVRWAAEQLAARIERISEAETAHLEDPEENETDSAPIEAQSSVTPSKIIGNTELLPPDGDDPFWDQLISGSIRRRLFYLSLRLDESLSRAEMIAVLSVDPAKLRAQVTPVIWTRTRDHLDDQFEKDTALIRSALAERKLPDSDDGRAELAQQLEASGPQVEFQRPTFDPDGRGLPVLVLTAIGRLLEAIKFAGTWFSIRSKHQPL